MVIELRLNLFLLALSSVSPSRSLLFSFLTQVPIPPVFSSIVTILLTDLPQGGASGTFCHSQVNGTHCCGFDFIKTIQSNQINH